MGLLKQLRGFFLRRPHAKTKRKGMRTHEGKALVREREMPLVRRPRRLGRRLDRRLDTKGYVNYNKKVKFTLRVDRELIADFKAFCERRGIFVNEVFEVYMRNALLKNSLETTRDKFLKRRSKVITSHV